LCFHRFYVRHSNSSKTWIVFLEGNKHNIWILKQLKCIQIKIILIIAVYCICIWIFFRCFRGLVLLRQSKLWRTLVASRIPHVVKRMARNSNRYYIISTRLRWISLKLYYKEKLFNYFPGGGILSNNAAENPYWWQANHVWVLTLAGHDSHCIIFIRVCVCMKNLLNKQYKKINKIYMVDWLNIRTSIISIYLTTL